MGQTGTASIARHSQSFINKKESHLEECYVQWIPWCQILKTRSKASYNRRVQTYDLFFSLAAWFL